MDICELFKNVEYTSKLPENIIITSVTSRIDEIDGGTLFVWLRGIKHNTDGLIAEIIKRSPALIVTENDIPPYVTIPTVKTKNARAALSHLLYNLYKIDPNSTELVGITGTNGKTTTATLLYEILKRTSGNVGFIGTGKIICNDRLFTESSYAMTTPDPELLYRSISQMQNAGVKTIIMEVSSHALALDKVAPLRFKLATFTNLSSEHLDFHKTIKEYFKAKLKLFKSCDNAVINTDTRFGMKAYKLARKNCNTVSCSIQRSGDHMAKNINSLGLCGSSFSYVSKSGRHNVFTPLIGEYNVSNALMAISASEVLGINAEDAVRAIKEIKTIDGRFEFIKDSVNVIIDYAHTPEAFEKVLKLVNSIKNKGQNVITLFGCGGERDTKKRPVMGAVAEKYSFHVYVTEDNPRGESKEKIIKDILAGIKDVRRRTVITSRTIAIKKAILSAENDDIILILGKGHERYYIDESGYHNYDERSIIRDALRKRGEKTK